VGWQQVQRACIKQQAVAAVASQAQAAQLLLLKSWVNKECPCRLQGCDTFW
jgi:hypothetical protein